MTRQEAIEEIVVAWGQRDSEFCIGPERKVSRNDCIEALRTLGVTEDELAEFFAAKHLKTNGS